MNANPAHVTVPEPPGVWPPQDLEAVDDCPVCHARIRTKRHDDLTDSVFFCSPGCWTLYGCAQCGSAYLNPRPTPQSLHRAYQNYYTHDEPWTETPPAGKLALFKRALRNGYLNAKYGYALKPALAGGRLITPLMIPICRSVDRAFRHLPYPGPGARLLDIGCGNGGFLLFARDQGWDVEGVDPDPQVAAKREGLRIRAGGLPDTGYPDATFDAVTLNHVIEHVYDPVASLREVLRILKPGGSLWLATPNLKSVGHRLFGRSWRGLETPRHLVLFTAASLRLTIAQAGFKSVRLMRTEFCAQWFFTASYRMSKGERPDNHKASTLPAPLDFIARLSDWRAFLQPQYGEEIVFTARRPD